MPKKVHSQMFKLYQTPLFIVKKQKIVPSALLRVIVVSDKVVVFKQEKVVKTNNYFKIV